ncbi:MAG: hypothetical protein ACRCSY_07545 [Cetobacterium sp.]
MERFKVDILLREQLLNIIDKNKNVFEAIKEIENEDMFLEKNTKRVYRVHFLLNGKNYIRIECDPSRNILKRLKVEIESRNMLSRKFVHASKKISCQIEYVDEWIEAINVVERFIKNTEGGINIENISLELKVKKKIVYR